MNMPLAEASRASTIPTRMTVPSATTVPPGIIHLVESLGSIYLSRCAVDHNSTAGDYAPGGGIDGFGYLINSTIAANITTGKHSDGGGINCAWIALTNSTVAYNSASGEAAVGEGISGMVRLTNSIVAGNHDGNTAEDVSGGISASNGSSNFGSTVANAAPGDLQNIPTQLLFAGGLADHGGVTQTIALRDASDNPPCGHGRSGLHGCGRPARRRAPSSGRHAAGYRCVRVGPVDAHAPTGSNHLSRDERRRASQPTTDVDPARGFGAGRRGRVN